MSLIGASVTTSKCIEAGGLHYLTALLPATLGAHCLYSSKHMNKTIRELAPLVNQIKERAKAIKAASSKI